MTSQRRGHRICGHCLTAPRSIDPQRSHAICRGRGCICDEAGHDPRASDDVAKALAAGCALSIEDVLKRDPGPAAA